MVEDWREQMKRVERQRAEKQAQSELRSAEADKRWAEADKRWASLGKDIRSLLAIAQTHELQSEEWHQADKKLRKANIKRETRYEWREHMKERREAGKVTDARLRGLLRLVERQSRDGHKHKRAED
jgi:hypothetical protein